MDWQFWLVLVCVILSFIFSASETALTSLGRLEIQMLRARDGWKARSVGFWIRRPNEMLVTILVGNNLVNFVATSVLTLWASRSYPSYVALVVGLFSASMIVICEIVPKVLARSHCVLLAPWAVQFLRGAGILLWPLLFVFRKISEGLTFLSGRAGRDLRQPMSEEELTHTIEIATKEGGIDRETGTVLTNLIDFPDEIARHVMTPRQKIQAVSIRWSLDEVLRFITQDGHSRYPVIRDNLDEIVGMILVKDLLAHLQRSSPGSWTRAIRRPYFISELAPLGTVLRDMKKWGTHMALVRNETGIVTGIVTLEDLIEEIVGEIRDEHDDPSDAGNEGALGGPVLVSGQMPLVDFNDRFKVSLPLDVSYSTLGGYLISKLGGQIPTAGTYIIDSEISFKVHSAAQDGIVTLEVLSPST